MEDFNGYQSNLSKELETDDKPQEKAKPSVVDDPNSILAQKVREAFQRAVVHKATLGINCRIFEAWHSLNQSYTPDQVAKIQKNRGALIHSGGFARLHRSFIAWYEDLMSQIKHRPWTLEPSPIPELPKKAVNEIVAQVTMELATGRVSPKESDIVAALRSEQKAALAYFNKKAEAAAARATTIIEDQMLDGDFSDALSQFMQDISPYPAAFLISPDLTVEPRQEWRGDRIKTVNRKLYKTTSIGPAAVFPMPDCSTTQDGEGLFVVQEVSRDFLANLLAYSDNKESGVVSSALKMVLEENGQGHWWGQDADMTGNALENGVNYYEKLRGIAGSAVDAHTFSVIRYWTKLSESDCDSMSIEHTSTVKYGMVPVEIWVCANRVIFAAKNNDGMGRRPVHKASYQPLPRSFWGMSLYDIVSGTEKIANKTIRELPSHLQLATSSIVEVDAMRMGKRTINNELPLNKAILTDQDYTRGGHGAFRVHQFQSHLPDVLQVMKALDDRIENLTGIRRFMSGATDLGVAGRTNGVVNALQTNSSKLIIQVQNYVNRTVIVPIVEQFYMLNLAYGDDRSMAGDLVVRVRGSDGLAQKEIFDAKIEKLMQYGMTAMMQPNAMTGETMLSPLDAQALLQNYFSANGYELQFTKTPQDALQLGSGGPSSMQGAMGTGGMPRIDGRSNPANLAPANVPIPAG